MNDAHPPLPRGLRLLGWSGTLPFVAALAVAALASDYRSAGLAAFVAYGAVILSFLGGARWGRALATGSHPLRFVEAVLPSLLAFTALLLLHRPTLCLSLLAIGFLAWMLVDVLDPKWSPAYRQLRLRISLLVLVLHAAWLLV